MKLEGRMAEIEASLDDAQSGMEACSRAAAALQLDTTKFNGNLGAPLLRSVLRHVKDLMACARDQRAALQQLRDGVTRFQEDLAQSSAEVRPPTARRHVRRTPRARSR